MTKQQALSNAITRAKSLLAEEQKKSHAEINREYELELKNEIYYLESISTFFRVFHDRS